LCGPLDHPILPSWILVWRFVNSQMYKLKFDCLHYIDNCFEQTPVMAFNVGVLQFVPKAHGRLVGGLPL
jgi:hypothetical protein